LDEKIKNEADLHVLVNNYLKDPKFSEDLYNRMIEFHFNNMQKFDRFNVIVLLNEKEFNEYKNNNPKLAGPVSTIEYSPNDVWTGEFNTGYAKRITADKKCNVVQIVRNSSVSYNNESCNFQTGILRLYINPDAVKKIFPNK
jgi:hypothetical protein